MYKKRLGLLIFMCGILMTNLSYAETLNDIRGMYGMLRSDSEKFKAQYDIVTQGYARIEAANKEADYVDSVHLEDLYKADYEQSIENYNNKVNELYTSFDGLAPVQSVYNIYNQVKVLKSNVEDNKTKLESLDLIYRYENNFSDSKAYVDYIKSSEGDTASYGTLGNYTPMPIYNTYYELELPYGDCYDYDGNVFRCNGVRFKLTGYSSIVSILNGTVSNITNSDDGKFIVKVNSGNCIEVTYQGLDEVDVEIGDTVVQRNSLGSASTYIYVEVRVDGILVNPLTLYQNKGQALYDEFIELNPDVVAKKEQVIFVDMNDANGLDEEVDNTNLAMSDLDLISDEIKQQYVGTPRHKDKGSEAETSESSKDSDGTEPKTIKLG